MFTVQKTLPKKNNKFYNTTSNNGYSHCIKGKPTKAGLNVLCNCVGYACGRFNEIYSQLSGYKGMKYWQLNCNAEDFIKRGKSIGLSVSTKPVAGGIMVWEGKGSLAGHVAVVEKVISSTEVLTSESGYNHFAFANYTRKKGTNGNWSVNANNYKYLGCLVNPAVKTTTKETKSDTSFFGKKGYFSSGDTNANIGKIADFMYKTFPAYTSKKALGNYYGPYLKGSITEFQKRTGLKADGSVGPKTLAKLKEYGFKG